MVLEVTESIKIPHEEFEWSFARAGGPGGQNVNKVSSKAVLHWDITASPSVPDFVKERFRSFNRKRLTNDGKLVMTSQKYRDQERNKEDCLEKVAELVREAARLPKKRVATKPSAGSKRRRLEDKKRQSQKKAMRGRLED